MISVGLIGEGESKPTAACTRRTPTNEEYYTEHLVTSGIHVGLDVGSRLAGLGD